MLIPVDDRDRGLFRLSRGWKRVRAEQAWGRSVVRAAHAGRYADGFGSAARRSR